MPSLRSMMFEAVDSQTYYTLVCGAAGSGVTPNSGTGSHCPPRSSAPGMFTINTFNTFSLEVFCITQDHSYRRKQYWNGILFPSSSQCALDNSATPNQRAKISTFHQALDLRAGGYPVLTVHAETKQHCPNVRSGCAGRLC